MVGLLDIPGGAVRSLWAMAVYRLVQKHFTIFNWPNHPGTEPCSLHPSLSSRFHQYSCQHWVLSLPLLIILTPSLSLWPSVSVQTQRRDLTLLLLAGPQPTEHFCLPDGCLQTGADKQLGCSQETWFRRKSSANYP